MNPDLERTGPTCAECDDLAAAVIDGRPLCGGHGLLVESWGIEA